MIESVSWPPMGEERPAFRTETTQRPTLIVVDGGGETVEVPRPHLVVVE